MLTLLGWIAWSTCGGYVMWVLLADASRDYRRRNQQRRERRQAQARGLTELVTDWIELLALLQLEAPLYCDPSQGIFTTPEAAAQARVLAACRPDEGLTAAEFGEVANLWVHGHLWGPGPRGE